MTRQHAPGPQRPAADPRPVSRRREQRVIDDDRPLRATFEITVVDGERGRQLALVQAQAIRKVLTWWSSQNTPQTTLDEAA